jgi:rare lipoprotein A
LYFDRRAETAEKQNEPYADIARCHRTCVLDFGSLVFDILLPAIEGAQAKTGNPASTVSVGGAARRAAVARMASRAARAPSSVTGRTSGLHAGRQAASRHNRKIRVVAKVQTVTKKKVGRLALDKRSDNAAALHGLATFYTDDTETASGERFDSRQMTAAHRTLPFGTRVRVTNVTNGRSVTVRVNDRGPFIPGRIVDVTSAAAEALGMVGQGVAEVRLDIVRDVSGRGARRSAIARKAAKPPAVAVQRTQVALLTRRR